MTLLRRLLPATILLGLLAPPALADWRTPLFDDFEGAGFAPAGGLFYKKNFEQSAGSVDFVKGPGAFSGQGMLKLSVRPLCPAGSGETCSERAEIWQKTKNRVPFDEGIWDGFAVKFGDPVPTDDHRYLIAQWKREIGPEAEGDFSPFLALRVNQGHLFVTVETNFHPAAATGPEGALAQCAAGQTPVWLRQDTNQMRAMAVSDDPGWSSGDATAFSACTDLIRVTTRGGALPRPASGWIDFVIYSRPGPDGTGHVELFANGKWIVTVTGMIGAADDGLGKNQYFKFGPYRAAGTGVWTMYYDDFRRSPSCMDVLKDADLCAKVAAE